MRRATTEEEMEMNKQPVSYLQTDPRWAGLDYSAPGEKTTIGASGCGPTAMAMVLATWADLDVNPKTECAWALKNGFKAPHSGTYYGYFEPAGRRYDLKVYRLNYTNIYGNATTAYHAQAKDAVDRGDLVIACMGKGNWTSSGHYVLVYGIEAGTVFINDPASTKVARTKGSYELFKKQVKYYWVIERPVSKLDTKKEDELDMTIDEMLNQLTDEQAYTLLQKAGRHAAKLEEPEWSQKEGSWAAGTGKGLTDGTAPERFAKRDEVMAWLDRLGLLD